MPINGNTRTFARADRRDVEIDLAGALAALDAHGGFQTLSYQEQAAYVFDYVFDPPATPPTPPTERPHVTPIGGNLGVKPLGSPDPTPIKPLPASKSSPRLHQYKFGPAGSIETIMLTTGQREALRTIASQEKIRRGGICPRRLLASATSTSLLRRDLVTKHDYPVTGYRLTERGQAVVAALTAD